MAKGNAKAKSTSSKVRNPDRPNGKAWKKKDPNKPQRWPTPERERKNFEIAMRREEKRKAGMARHRAELAAAEEEEKAERQKTIAANPGGVARRVKQQRKPKMPREITIGEFREMVTIFNGFVNDVL